MKRNCFAALALAVLALVLAPGAWGGEPVTLDKLELGTHVCGDRVTQEDLAGHVVLVFFWDLG